jgi:hypothetical protein
MKRAILAAVAVLGVLAITPAAWATFGDCNGNNSCNTTTTNNQGKGGDGGNATATGGNATVGNVTGGNATNQNTNNANNDVRNTNNNSDSVSVNVEGDDVEAAANSVPVYTSPIVASEDTCMGSVSGGAGFGAMSFTVGVSVGSTYTDENCQNLKWYREFAKSGMDKAAMSIACQANDGRNVVALEAQGYDCGNLTGGVVQTSAVKVPAGTLQTASAAPASEPSVHSKLPRGNNK